MTSSVLKAKILEDMKTAMRAQDKPLLQTIRLITAAIKQKEVDDRVDLSDADILAILDKMLKQRRDSIQQFEAAQREDLAEQERFELGVIQSYLPAALSEEEVEGLIEAALQSASALGPQAMGAVMALLKPQLQGRADLSKVSQQVKARLMA